jgi:hypothetical protein
MKESRLDRIEKALAEFIQGMKEERAAFAEERAAFVEERAAIAELRASIAEDRKANAELRASIAEDRKANAELRASIAESQKKTDEQILELKESQKKTDRQIAEIGRQLGDLGLVQGEIAEDLFYRNVEYIFDRRKLRFGNIYRNLKKKGIAEYDIVAVDDDRILVIEVKNKLDTRMVDRFVNDKLPKFRQAFPEYRDHRLLGGMGALVVKDAVGRYAEKAGLYVLTQNGEGGAMLINPKNFRAKEFL